MSKFRVVEPYLERAEKKLMSQFLPNIKPRAGTPLYPELKHKQVLNTDKFMEIWTEGFGY